MNISDATIALKALDLTTGEQMNDEEKGEFIKIALESTGSDELIAFSEKMFEKYKVQDSEKENSHRDGKTMRRVESLADELIEDNQAVIVSVANNDSGNDLVTIGQPLLIMGMILIQTQAILKNSCCESHLEEFKQDMAQLLLEGMTYETN